MEIRENFIEFSKIDIEDHQFEWLSLRLEREALDRPFSKMKADPDFEVDVLLQRCEVVKEFWKNPYTVLTILVLTVGKIYECKTSLQITDLNSNTTRNIENSVREYGFTGFPGLLALPFAPSLLNIGKSERVRYGLHMYFKETGMLPVDKQN